MPGAATGRVKALLHGIVAWTALSWVLNLAWETAQLPLYAIWYEANAPYIAYAVLHCTVGDGLIAAASFALAAVCLRESDWIKSRPWRGGTIAVAAGLAYTAFSEWQNVYQLGSWAYAPTMPLIFGIGLSPLLQWLVLPVAGILLLRFFRGRRARLQVRKETRNEAR